MNRNPATMTPEEIIQEISDLQAEVKRQGLRIHELAQVLYQRVRRAPPDDATSIYMTYSTLWIRFAGVISQGLARTSNAGRVLRRLPPKVEEQPTRKPPPAPRPNPTDVESLIRMYDEEPIAEDEGTESVEADGGDETSEI